MVEAVKDNGDFLSALKELSPWAEAAFSAAKDSIGPVKFVIKLFEELTKIQDPEELVRLACTLAYQSSAEKAIQEVGSPSQAKISAAKLSAEIEEVDFSYFSLNQVVSHPFVAKADQILSHYLPQAGYTPEQVNRIVDGVHTRMEQELDSLISHGKTKEKFDGLHRWLSLNQEGRVSRAALRRHAEFTSWQFTQAPVLQREPYALQHVCLAAECSKLTHKELTTPPREARPQPNPFLEGDVHGGRHPFARDRDGIHR
ncbi:MAG: hypothetical protein HY820_02770 [Acidobacteria bacterium]|nr:hypothetical protein [Acidobacteriota bacterium]